MDTLSAGQELALWQHPPELELLHQQQQQQQQQAALQPQDAVVVPMQGHAAAGVLRGSRLSSQDEDGCDMSPVIRARVSLQHDPHAEQQQHQHHYPQQQQQPQRPPHPKGDDELQPLVLAGHDSSCVSSSEAQAPLPRPRAGSQAAGAAILHRAGALAAGAGAAVWPFVTPPLMGCLLSVLVGTVPPLRHAFFDEAGVLNMVQVGGRGVWCV
jgi:hypothetical protein